MLTTNHNDNEGNIMWKYLLSILRDKRGFATLNLHTYVSGQEWDDAIPEFWGKRLYDDGIRKAFWGARFEGREGSAKPIITKDDFTKGPGDTLHFQVMSDLISSGVTGEGGLQGNEDKLSMSQFDLTVDWIRNAVAYTENLERRVNFSVVQVARQRLSDWIARYIDEGLFTQLIITEGSAEVLYSGDAGSESALGDNDTFGTEEIDRIKLALQRKGAIPLSTKMNNGEELETYGIVISGTDEYWLKGDPIWSQAQRDAGIRGEKNKIFTGALGMYNGMILYTHRSVKSGPNIQGSPLRPEVSLTTGLDNSIGTLVTGTNAKADYTKFFPSTGTLRIDAEEISYSSKSVTGFTVDSRGVNGTSAAAHTAGALITLRNISTQIGFGAEVAVRGWGMKPTPIHQTFDYGFENGIGVKAIFGQVAIKNTNSVPKNYLLAKSYAKNPSTI